MLISFLEGLLFESLTLRITNVLSVPPAQFPTGVVIGVVVAVLLLLVASIMGYLIWKRNYKGKMKTILL